LLDFDATAPVGHSLLILEVF